MQLPALQEKCLTLIFYAATYILPLLTVMTFASVNFYNCKERSTQNVSLTKLGSNILFSMPYFNNLLTKLQHGGAPKETSNEPINVMTLILKSC